MRRNKRRRVKRTLLGLVLVGVARRTFALQVSCVLDRRLAMLAVLVLNVACSKPEAAADRPLPEPPGARGGAQPGLPGAVASDRPGTGGLPGAVASDRPGTGGLPGASGGLPPLSAESTTVKLPLDGLGPATVEVPVGATEPRPVVVAVHGHSVRPEHACKSWRRASGDHAFVLCPHGLPADAKPEQVVTLGSDAYTLREIDAGLAALRARFGSHVAPGPIVYAGYSLGARRGVEIVGRHPDRFRRVALGEGGYDQLQRPVLDAFAKGGVERLLLVCSSKACELTFARVQTECERVGLPCRIVRSGENPHLFANKVVEATREQWPWLVQGAWAKSGPSAHAP